MYKVSALVLVFVLMVFAVSTYASTEGEGLYVINRGIVGIVYKVITGACKVVEAVIFGRYGVRGVVDYMHVDKVFVKQTPKY